MTKKGALTFVLHSHLPYFRMAGRWPPGEEWLHEAASETYIPLLNALYDLHEEGVPAKLTIGLTPVLCEQLADPVVQEHFDAYLEEKIEAAASDIPRFQKEGNPHAEYLATFYRDWYTGIRRSFQERYNRDLIGAFRRLQDAGVVEIITSAATHGYLPLLGQDAAIHGQLRAVVASYERLFGRTPRAVWLPECAYRPAYVADDGTVRRGIEGFLADLGLGCFFSETHTIEGGRPVGKAAGDAIGPYGAIVRRYVIPPADYVEPTARTTFQPYLVVTTDPEATSQHSGVAVVGRNNRTGQQVWSADWGYPGDYDYREFHKKDGTSGMQYWRVTAAKTDLGSKDWYHPDWAQRKMGEHARHYAWLVGDLLTEYHRQSGRFGLVASNYDSELFGHWWFEGVDWIREVLRRLAESDAVELTTISEYLAAHPPEEVLALPEGSWGAGGGHWTWDNPDTHWMWLPIHEAEARMVQLAAQFPGAEGDALTVLNQAARELLLLEASDWPFLVTTGQAREYAVTRFSEHVNRFQQLADSVGAGAPDRALADELWEVDKVFPDVDYRWWGE